MCEKDERWNNENITKSTILLLAESEIKTDLKKWKYWLKRKKLFFIIHKEKVI